MSNTYSSTLVTDSLKKGAITVLQNRRAMLSAFSTQFEPDPVKPLATCQIKKVTAGSTTLTDATNFQQGNSTVVPVSVTMHQYTQPFQISNADLNNGLALEDLAVINAGNFADKISDVVLAPVTVANFGAAVVTTTSPVFGLSDLQTLFSSLKKSSIKNLILDGSYFAQISNQPGFFQPTGATSGNGWKPYGWDYIGEQTRWDGADAKVVGFACNPSAIAVVAGLPVDAGRRDILSREDFMIPGLQVKVALFQWFDTVSRTIWASYDVMLGAKEADTTAGKLLMSP